MNRGVWVGGLFLSLCGWASQAGAQDVVWRPAMRPGDPPPPASFRALPAAALGRPMSVHTTPPGAGPCTGVIAASYRADSPPKPVPRVLPDDGLDALEIAAPAANADLPIAPTLISSPSFPDGAAPADAAQNIGFAGDRAIRPAAFAAQPVIAGVVVPEPVAVAPKPGPAPEEAGPALAPPTPTEVEAGPPAEDVELFPNVASWPPHFYARGEYLLWSVKKDTAPPLVTTSTNPFDFGVLGAPTTHILFGGDGLNGGDRSGVRFTVGLWLDDCESKAIEVSGFFLGDKTQTFTATSAQFPVIARPFFNLNTNMEDVQVTTFDNQVTGSIAVRDTSSLWGVEANARCCLCCGEHCPEDCDNGAGWHYRVDGLAGFRYLDLREDLSITENFVAFPNLNPNLTNLGGTVFDDFATHNQFYGAQVGLDGTVDLGRWSLNLTGKLAIGDTHQEVSIHGDGVITQLNGTVATVQGGLLALPSNIGTFHRDAFSVVPEGNVTASYHVNDHVRLFAGYDVLYWSSVVRPGQQIDRNLDTTQIPFFNNPPVPAANLGRPEVLFQRSDFWAQGLNLGLEFRY